MHLLVNAAHAIGEGDVEAHEIRITTSTDAAGRVVVEVRDTGHGLPAGVLGRLFEPFFTTKPIGGGVGLGLSVCRNIVTAMGGQITASNNDDRGATFRVVLPAAPAPSAPEGTPDAEASGRRGNVLIVDDEPMVGASLARLLRGHDVTVLTRASEALALLAAGRSFDLILSDLMMPEMSGVELYQQLEELFPDAAPRVVFVTGGAFSPAARAFLDRVANERLNKPVDAQVLRALVRRRIS
jgi:CheY-like chemotaxis protein